MAAERAAIVAALLLASCGGGNAGDAGALDAAGLDAGPDAGLDAAPDAAVLDASGDDAGVAPDYLTTLRSEEDYAALSLAQGVKYLLRVEGAPPRAPLLERCYFQNTKRWEFHIEFLHSFPELATLTSQDYQALVLRPATRIWWGGGTIVLRQRHPISGAPASLAYQIYAENGAVVGLREADIVEVDALLRACIPYAADRLAFFPGDPFQESFARSIAASLAQRGIAVLLP